MRLKIRQRTFPLFERLGFHLVPNHFNQPIPDTRRLPASLWSQQSELVGIDLNECGQLALLATLESKYKHEWDGFPRTRPVPNHRYYVDNRIFESVDGEMLYAMIRSLRPRRIVEVGSGFSTMLSVQAIARNREEDPDYACDLMAIEPAPSDDLRRLGAVRLLISPVQEVPLDVFTSLGPGDILFIDSSHILRIGSDVQFECLEVLPRLRPGVVVHFHDIFLPSEYPRDTILTGYQFPNEQYLVQAFLTYNRAFEILFAASFMHLRHPDRLERAFASYERTRRWPGSLWLRRVPA